MVARPGTFIASNNAGELKPELHRRTDLKQFYAGLAYALNVESVPQGGSRLTPRTRHKGSIRNKIEEIDGATVVISGLTFAVAGTFVEISFPSSRDISMVAITGGADVELPAILAVEYWDGADWIAVGDAFTMQVAAKTHTIALPPGQTVRASDMRCRLTATPPAPVTFAITSVSCWSETATPPAVRLTPFTFALDQSYVCALTHRAAEFYRNGTWVGGALTPIAESQLPLVTPVQRGDTLMLFHEDVPSCRILRNGSDSEWVMDDLPYENVPNVDLGGTYTNQVTDVWKVYFRYPTSGTYANGIKLYLSITVNGEETEGVETGATVNWTTFAAAVASALTDLPSVGAGVTVTETHSSGLTILTVSFLGEQNIGQRFALTAQVVNTSEAAATVTHTQLGSPGGEALMSAGRGWPAAAGFFQDRLVTGGYKSKRSALLASVTGEYFDQNTEIAAANGAILVNLDTDGAERIHTIARARHLMIFTSDAEYFVSDRALNRQATPNIVNCSRNGSAENVPIVESEGALIYASRNAAIIYAASYDDVSQAYVSTPISLLASHIASDVIDMALQKATTATDAGRLWMVRADGTVTLGLLLRNQDVTSFNRWRTDGDVKSVCVDGVNDIYLAVARVAGGATRLFLEVTELGLWLDGAVTQTLAPAAQSVTGLDIHEGAEVWAVADGYVSGPHTVAAGAIELPAAASGVTVGRWTAPDVVTLPLPQQVAERAVLRRPIRVHTVRVDAVDTTSIAVGANGRAPRNVELYRAGDPVDQALAPVSRQVAITGLIGFSETGQVRITQTRPGALAWSGITIEART